MNREEIKWHIYPMVKAALPFAIGVLIYKVFPGYVLHSLSILIVSFTFLFISIWNKKHLNWQGQLKVVLIYLIFLLLGYLRVYTSQYYNDADHYGNYDKNATIIHGIVQEIPIERTSLKTEIELVKMCYDQECINVGGNALVYFNNKIVGAKKLKPGDLIEIRSKLTDVKSSSNPHSFDFRDYLYNRGIISQAYIWSEEQYRLVSSEKLSPIYQLAMNTRAWCLEVLNKYVHDENKIAVVSALILGYRNLLNQDTYKAFSDTGAVHILAVSGMHLTLISGAIYFLLNLAKIKNPTARIIIQMCCIWFFTFITGVGAAILRAAVMLTIVVYAKETKRNYNIYNILGLVCFLILLYEPGQLFQAGFQFSICAVTSLIFFQEYIENKIYFENTFLAFVWKYISTSISATILVTPLTIYFFHKFPVYFILSGLVPVISSTLAMYLGIVMMFSEAFSLGFINVYLGYVLNFLLGIFLGSIQWIKSLPWVSINGITLSNLEFALMMLSLLLIMIYLTNKNLKVIYTISTFTLMILMSLMNRIHNANHQAKIIVYDVNKGGSIDFMDGRAVYNYSVRNMDEMEANFIYQNNRYFHFTDEVVALHPDDQLKGQRIRVDNRKIKFKDKNIYILDELYFTSFRGFDYIYITNNVSFDPSVYIDNNTICIIDKSLDYENQTKWRDYFIDNDIKYKSVKEEGSITINI